MEMKQSSQMSFSHLQPRVVTDSHVFLAEHADILLHKAFIVGIYGQTDTSSVIAESMKVLRMEAT